MASRALRVAVSVAVSLALLGTGALPAGAVVRDSDLVGDARVSDLPADISAKAPDLGAASGVLVTGDGRVLWAREPDAERAMASTTKIMTAVVAVEHSPLDEPVTVTEKAIAVGESAARLRPGATYSLRTLLEATLVRSGNDASMAVAEHVGGSVEGFVSMMNEKARELGLEHTAFANPHGLDESGHYTTANDLATLARYAMANPDIRHIVGIKTLTIEGAKGPMEYENSNVLLGTLEGATGVKTGWTSKAGYCLVASAERYDTELYAVVLGTSNENERFQQAGLLLEWGFAHYTEQHLAQTGEVLGTVSVADYLDRSIDAVVGEPAALPVLDLAGDVTRKIDLPDSVDAPVARGDRIGTLSLVQGERLLAQVPIIAIVDVRKPTLPERAWIALVRTWRSVFGGGGAREAIPAT